MYLPSFDHSVKLSILYIHLLVRKNSVKLRSLPKVTPIPSGKL